MKHKERVQWHHYYSTLFSQKPYTDHILPVIENLYLNQKNNQKERDWDRYHYTFVFNKEHLEDPTVLDLEIDIRFVKKIMRNTISVKLNQIGIHTRQFYSSDYKKVFIVLKSQENVLKL